LRRRPTGVSEFAAVITGFAAVTALLTYPLAFNLDTLGYKLHVPGDPQYSVWNVAWVAHALLNDPLNVFNANIFFPHKGTLSYSEANLAAGALGAPVYWLTGNVYATHNFVVLLSFILSATGAYYLIRYITQDRRAAVVGAICFGYCPYVFGHLPHIQLLMTAGIPFSLLAFHRLADRASPWRGAALGLAMGLQALACAYYSVFLVLIIGLAVFITAARRRLWSIHQYWLALAAGAVVAVAIVTPLFGPYAELQSEYGFSRALDDSRRFSANWLSYLTSARYTSAWLNGGRTGWTDVLFPGFLSTILGVAALWTYRSATPERRDYTLLYGALSVFAFWQSFGPKAGLYSASYYLIPAFSFLRAPSRFGVVVALGMSVLAGITIARLLQVSRRQRLVGALLVLVAIIHSRVPIQWSPNPELAPVYRELAHLPDGGLIEFPLYSRTHNINRTRYMLGSTVHWKPLVNAYSDVSPDDWMRRRDKLADFPSQLAFEHLPQGVRYAVFHLEEYRNNELMEVLEASLAEFSPHLEPLYADEQTWLYEIVGSPPSVLPPPHSPSSKTGGR
jgi:hypothetical protein